MRGRHIAPWNPVGSGESPKVIGCRKSPMNRRLLLALAIFWPTVGRADDHQDPRFSDRSEQTAANCVRKSARKSRRSANATGQANTTTAMVLESTFLWSLPPRPDSCSSGMVVWVCMTVTMEPLVSRHGELHLSFTFANTQECFRLAEEFIPVSWGQRKYLIPSGDVVGFCNEVNAGNEPRQSSWLVPAPGRGRTEESAGLSGRAG